QRRRPSQAASKSRDDTSFAGLRFALVVVRDCPGTEAPAYTVVVGRGLLFCGASGQGGPDPVSGPARLVTNPLRVARVEWQERPEADTLGNQLPLGFLSERGHPQL